MPVSVAVVTPQQVDESTEYIATLKALRSTVVKPQVDGQITRVFVRSGDRVSPGTPMLQIDPARQQASVQTLQAALAAFKSLRGDTAMDGEA